MGRVRGVWVACLLAFVFTNAPSFAGCETDYARASGAPRRNFFLRNLVDPVARTAFRWALKTRYKITTEGLDQIDPGKGGVLVLPNHPGMLDPLIQYLALYSDFRVRPVMIETEANRPGTGWLARQTNPFLVPDVSAEGSDARSAVDELARRMVEALDRGENLLMYPEGQLSRNLPDVTGKSLVEAILKLRPNTRLVLSQMDGFMGSSFSTAQTGDFPDVETVLPKRVMDLLANGIFFGPKRPIHIKYVEPKDFPRTGTRTEINDYLTRFYQDGLKPPTYVPYRRNEPPSHVTLPFASMPKTTVTGDITSVPAHVREEVMAKLREMTGVREIRDTDSLSHELGLDSLDQADFNLWLESTFKDEHGQPIRNSAPIPTVAEALLIASGKMATRGSLVRPPDGRWIRDTGKGKPIEIPRNVETLWDALALQMRRNPDKVIFSDNKSGPVTYRELGMAIGLFSPKIREMPGQNIGVMLPASVGDNIVTWSVLAADKTAVEINFTAGENKVKHTLDSNGVEKVITSKEFVERLAKTKGITFESIKDRFIYVEDIRSSFTTMEKMMALWNSQGRNHWQHLPKPNLTPDSISVILATSGSKSLPKSVPYTHRGELTNTVDLVLALGLTDRDRIMTIAPPFHSLGHRLKIAAAAGGVPQVFHTDPTEGSAIAQLSEFYKPTIVVGTPTFLKGIAWSAESGQLDSLRVAIVGAEKLTPDVVDAAKAKNPKMVVAEGYGLTETYPVIFVNPLDAPKIGTLGKPLSSIDAMIVDPTLLGDHASAQGAVELAAGKPGMLLVAPKDEMRSSIMNGYLAYADKQPFVTIRDRKWFITGDLVKKRTDGYYEFVSRLERSVKIGGEMVPLDGLEEDLLKQPFFAEKLDKTPILAIEPTPVDSNPDLVLFTTLDITRERANELLRAAGSVKVAKIARVVKVPNIPMLGTGKLDRNPLRTLLKDNFKKPEFFSERNDGKPIAAAGPARRVSHP